MAEWIAKGFYILVVSSFSIGVWVTGIQLIVLSHSEELKAQKAEINQIKLESGLRSEKIVEGLGRIDERLKNIERKLFKQAHN